MRCYRSTQSKAMLYVFNNMENTTKIIETRRINKYKNGHYYTEYKKFCRICKTPFWASKKIISNCSKSCSNSIENKLEKFFKEKLSRLRSNAKKRKKDFNLFWFDLLEIYNKQNGKCFYTGIEMELSYSVKTDKVCPPTQLSVDRLDSKKGYEKKNIVLCIFCINNFKGEMSIKEFNYIISKIKKYEN